MLKPTDVSCPPRSDVSGRSPWALVLAGGAGQRLSPLTKALYGYPLPKQFAVLHGRRSMLQETLMRVAPLVPAERCVVVVREEDGSLAGRQLEPHRGAELVLQPRNLDTGPGILLGLARIWQLAGEGTPVIILPSDHFVGNPAPLVLALRTALRVTATLPQTLVLLGVTADRPECDYGWIVTGSTVLEERPEPVRAVSAFVEKPDGSEARRLHENDALWNTSILVGLLRTFWSQASRHLPYSATVFTAYRQWARGPANGRLLGALYDWLSASNFSRDVLARAGDLAVVRVDGAEWSDWGSPSRVLETHARRGTLESLLQRCRGRQGLRRSLARRRERERVDARC